MDVEYLYQSLRKFGIPKKLVNWMRMTHVYSIFKAKIQEQLSILNWKGYFHREMLCPKSYLILFGRK
jgi:hypothetical protein